MRKQVRQKDERGWFEVERQTGIGMKHFTIIELDKNFSIPENLSECTQEQYIDANRFIYAYQNGLIRSEEHTSELQSRGHLVCRLLLEKKKKKQNTYHD